MHIDFSAFLPAFLGAMLSFVVPPRALTRAVQAAAFVRNVVSVILCFPYNDGKLEDSTDFHQKLGDVDWSKDGPLTSIAIA